MTKSELEKKLIALEQELHEAHNSIEYWQEETEAYRKLYFELQTKVECDEIYSFLKDCSIVDKEKLIEYISSL